MSRQEPVRYRWNCTGSSSFHLRLPGAFVARQPLLLDASASLVRSRMTWAARAFGEGRCGLNEPWSAAAILLALERKDRLHNGKEV